MRGLTLVILLIASCGGEAASTTASTATPASSTSASVSTTSAGSSTSSTTAPPTTQPSGTQIDVTLLGEAVSVSVNGADVQVGDRIAVDLGTTVVVVRWGDEVEIHVHTYDYHLEVEEGRLEFTADIPGIFEVEVEDSGLLLFQLEVS